MAQTEHDPDEQYERKATLVLTMKADSGYYSNEQHRVSADQWARILQICAEGQLEKDALREMR